MLFLQLFYESPWIASKYVFLKRSLYFLPSREWELVFLKETRKSWNYAVRNICPRRKCKSLDWHQFVCCSQSYIHVFHLNTSTNNNKVFKPLSSAITESKWNQNQVRNGEGVAFFKQNIPYRSRFKVKGQRGHGTKFCVEVLKPSPSAIT